MKYTIQTRDNGEIRAAYNVGDPNRWTRGENATFEFELPTPNPEDLTISSDETIVSGTVIRVATLTVESGATLTIESDAVVEASEVNSNGTINVKEGGTLDAGAFETAVVNELVEWAGSFATQRALNGVVRYRSQIPDAISLGSLAVGIEPAQSLQNENMVGVWGLIENVDNRRNQPLTTNRYELSVRVLSKFDEYADHTALENALKI